MEARKIRHIGVALVAALWAAIALFAWLKPADAQSDAERRPLAQLPEISAESLLSADFMKDFETYSLDQFPLRDTFRSIKALFHYNVLGQKDNNGIYIVRDLETYAAKLEYPLNETGVGKATDRFNFIYETYLKDSGCQAYCGIIPDKGYFLAEKNGYPAMDYDKLFSMVQTQMPWATHIDLTENLILEDYYHTDTHWRQEKLIPTAQNICQTMGVSGPDKAGYQANVLSHSFYGVYYGQAAIPMEPDELAVLEADHLSGCVTYALTWDTNNQTAVKTKLYDGVYDLSKVQSKDPYDVFLSGPQSVLVIENPNAKTDKELIIFRDSYGSSLTPLLLEDYAKVTLVDIRYIPSDMLGSFVEFKGQDVLFLYSTLILNSGAALK